MERYDTLENKGELIRFRNFLSEWSESLKEDLSSYIYDQFIKEVLSENSIDLITEKISEKLEDRIKSIIILENPSISPNIQKEKTLEESIFRIITNVYLEEEKLKREQNLRRKSGIRISKNIGNELRIFFSKVLPDFKVSSIDGLVFFAKEDYRSVLKVFTDLGFHRGENWYNQVLDTLRFVKLKYSIPPQNVFFLVTSMANSLDNDHVCKTLSQDITNTNILIDRTTLNKYITKYVENIPWLPNKLNQIYFLGAEIHPNSLANEWLNYDQHQSLHLETYNWLRPSISEFISFLKKEEREFHILNRSNFQSPNNTPSYHENSSTK